ncbi:YcaO-like family protein [Burkholderia cepacia]|uniref:YcaO-like family protein n=1 Tax=Burkholderia cepacia TaxID=292 RepID=UPI0035277E4B
MIASELERKVSLQDAEGLVDEYFKENRIRVELSRFGDPLSSTVATLHLPDGSTCVGCGKGYEAEARVGAKFEAYEHHVGLAGIRAHGSVVHFSEMARQSVWENFLPLDMIRKQNPEKIAAIEFEANIDERGPLLFPQFLIDYLYATNRRGEDDVDYHDAKRYSCGTGLAVGVGFEEAAIHALSEVIERHAVGRFLADLFFYQISPSIKIVSRETFPAGLADLVAHAETLICGRVDIIDVGSEIRAPVFAAYCQDRDIAGVHVIGAGCSLYPTHAAARAVKELVQQYKIADGVELVRREWARHYMHLEKYPKLLRCLIADMSAIRRQEVAMAYDPPAMNLASHLDHLLAACRFAGTSAWVKQLRLEMNGICLACAVMPKMERFSTVSLGNYVIPTCNPAMRVEMV